VNRVLYKIKKILTNEMVYIASDILIKAIAFITLPLFVNKMTPTDFGEFSLYQTYISLFGTFFSLNIFSGIVRYYTEKENEKKHLTTALWINMIFGIIGSGFAFLLESYFNILNVPFKVLYIICICAVFQGLVSIGLENIRAMIKPLQYGFFSLLISVTSTVLGLILVYSVESELGYWRLISITFSTFLIGIILVIGIVNRDGFIFEKETAKYLLAYSLPLIPYSLSTIIISQINRVFLADIGLSEVGIFSFASNLAMIIYIIAISLNRAYQPYLFRALRDKMDCKTRMYQNIALFYIFYIAFIFFSEIFIWIFGNEEYSSAADVIPIIVLGYGYFFLYSLGVNYLYYYKKNIMISLFSMISAGIIIIFNTVLIPLYGYTGAAWATVIAYFTLFVFTFIYINLNFKINIISIKNMIIFQVMLFSPVLLRLFISK
jgi:O-antigen/teichoic acid export membrane protein